MATINLGGIIGGNNGTNGIVSGLDSATIIDNLKAIRQAEVDSVQTTIDTNSEKISKFGEFTTLLNSLKSSADFLRNSFSLNQFSNVFDYKVATTTSSTISSPSSYITVDAQPNALNGSIDIQVGNVAESLQERSSNFSAYTTSATTSATGSYFDVGTFRIGSGIAQEIQGTALSGYQLQSSDYSAVGTGAGILTANGIESFSVVGASGGDADLQGTSISGFEAVVSGTGTTTITVDINDSTYTAEVSHFDAVTGGVGIASGTDITFTTDSGGVNETSFTVQLSSDVIIDGDQANGDIFAADLETALADVTIFQARQISNLDDNDVRPAITGLTSSDVKFSTNFYNNETLNIGTIADLSVVESTGADGEISITINNEEFKATGLSTSLNTSITLTSEDSDRELVIDFTGVNADISSESAADSTQRALEYFVGIREVIDIEVEEGDSLRNIITNINQNSITTGLAAGVVQISDNDFQFNLKATNVGLDNTYEIFDDSNILSNITLSTVQAAEDATIKVDGVEISRSSNSISDVIENVTINVLQETPDYGLVSAESIETSVVNDDESVITGLVGFINAYNAIRVFASQQSQRNPETQAFTEEAILGGDALLENVNSLLLNELNGIVSTGNSKFSVISDAQVTLQDFAGDSENVATNNILSYDEAKLREVLASNFDDIRKIFELNITSSSDNLIVTGSSNNASLSEFRLSIDTSQEEGSQVKLQDQNGTDILDSSGDPIYLELSSGTITGPVGSPLEGFSFIYTGDGTDDVDVTITQGVADRIYNIADSYTEKNGLIDLEVSSLTERNTDLGADKTTLERRLETYVEGLVAQYAALEAAIQGFNSVILLLDAQADANSS